MLAKGRNNAWLFFLLIITGLVIGGFLGEYLSQFKYLEFLNYGKPFGINPDRPFMIDINVIKLSFAIVFKLNFAGVLGMIASIAIYYKM